MTHLQVILSGHTGFSTVPNLASKCLNPQSQHHGFCHAVHSVVDTNRPSQGCLMSAKIRSKCHMDLCHSQFRCHDRFLPEAILLSLTDVLHKRPADLAVLLPVSAGLPGVSNQGSLRQPPNCALISSFINNGSYEH